MSKKKKGLDKTLPYQIRPMELKDIDRVFEIETSAHKSPWFKKIFHDCVVIGYDCRILEVVDNQGWTIVGFIISRQHDNICHILNLCVVPPYQKLGYGKAMLTDQIERLYDTQYKHIILEVRPSNHRAIELYKHFGFIQVKRKKDYYRDDNGMEDAIVLQKTLSNS